ncbi:uncharacterized protein LOC131662992 [Phymastichus coffea]|uniref:uncharacterized protein LOC131662992 n=1 Tax=Phymastichus coffea TaxID=108790 RepID=UPI00273C060E|nr:uncharacterized protein LOC131662992 [Phymastichus coffea]
MIVTYLEDHHKNWDEKLVELSFDLNTAIHSTTKVSPALLNYGRQPVPPGTQRRQQDSASAENEEEQAKAEWAEHLGLLSDWYDEAAARTKDEQERQAPHYDKKHRPHKFKVGDWV